MMFIRSIPRSSPNSKSLRETKTRRGHGWTVATLLSLTVGFSGLALGDDKPGDVPKQDLNSRPVVEIPETKPQEKARRTYLGRIVAQPMSHMGASWLIRPEREIEESVREAYTQLEVQPGMTICDLGCGNGFWTIPLAKAVGETGKIYAVDIQREMLLKLRERASKENLENIIPVRGDVDDPNLPEGVIDMVLLVDVYHEFSHPTSMLWEIRRSLKPNGVVALLEYREEDPEVPIKPLHKMSKVQILKEYEANGFKLVREYNKLPWQHLMFLARDDSPLAEIEPLAASEVLRALKQPEN